VSSTMRELLIATKNPGKFHEIDQALKGSGYRLLFLGDLDIDDSGFLEDGESFKENSYKKARFYFDKLGMLTLGEDSGIEIEALKGELGVKTRRWGAGEKASDEEWIEYFLQRMEGEQARGAKFICSACLLDGEREEYFGGETRGWITEGLQAPLKRGIPLSSCFLPEGSSTVYAALSEAEKNKLSHRGKALRGVREYLALKREK